MFSSLHVFRASRLAHVRVRVWVAYAAVNNSSTLSLVASASAPAIDFDEDEVERKFAPTPGVRARLARLVAPNAKARSDFTDRYFDAPSTFLLTRRDCWLRRRDATWELKSPQSPPPPERAGTATNTAATTTTTTTTARTTSSLTEKSTPALVGVDYYRESRDWATISSIVERLAGVRLPPPFPADAEAAEAWLAARGLALFANVRTLRERCTLHLERGHRVRVDLDSVAFLATTDDHGSARAGPADVLSRYEIGEVELVAAGGGASPAEALADAFGQLGIGAEPVRGKLLELLSRHRRDHYEALRESGLLAAKLGGGTASG